MKSANPTYNESDRLNSLHELDILDSPEEETFDEITKLAAEICETPISLVSLVDKDRQWFKSHQGLDARETPRDLAFCAHAIHKNKIFEVEDSRNDDRFFDNPLVTSAPNVIFYAGIPLEAPGNKNLGTLCVIDHKPKKLNDFQKRALIVLGKQVSAQLELKRRLKHLKQSIEDLKKSNQCQRDFFANLSHELRTPINGIIGYTELLLDSETDKEKLSNLESVDKSSRILFELVNNVLDFSKVEAGEMTLETAPYDLQEMRDEIAATFQLQMKKKELNFLIKMDECTPNSIMIDGLKLKQTIMNLVSNAYKFTKEGSVTLEIKFDSSKEELSFSVQDTGPGIPEDKKNDLFAPFKQIEGGPRSEIPGTGLGLAITSRTIKLLGGNLECHSRVGKGSEFKFTIPIVRSKNKKNGDDCLSLNSKFVDLNVLVVDDSEINRDIAAKRLERFGTSVQTAGNGASAIDLANNKFKFDLIFLDINMPDMNGYQVLEKIKKSGQSCNCMAAVLSGTSLNTEINFAMDNGFHAYYTKPIRKKEFEEALEKALEFRKIHTSSS